MHIIGTIAIVLAILSTIFAVRYRLSSEPGKSRFFWITGAACLAVLVICLCTQSDFINGTSETLESIIPADVYFTC